MGKLKKKIFWEVYSQLQFKLFLPGPSEDQAAKRHLVKQKSNRKKNAWNKPFKHIQKKQN